MAGESHSGNPLKVLFDNLTWILPLVGVEQIVGQFVHIPNSDWRVGLGLMVLGVICYSLTGGWSRIPQYITNLRRLRIVRLPGQKEVDIVEEGRQRALRSQIRRHVQSLVQTRLILSHDAVEAALRKCAGDLPNQRIVGELVRGYEYLLEDCAHKNGAINVAANRSLQDAPEEIKTPVDQLVEQMVDAISLHFRLWRAFNGLLEIPEIRDAAPRPEISIARDALELLKSDLRDAAHMDGFGSVRHISEHLQPSSPVKKTPIADELTKLRAEGLHSIRNEFEANPQNLRVYLLRETEWSARIKETMARLGCTTLEISKVMDLTNSEIGRAAAGANYGPDGNWLIGLMEMRLSRLLEVIAAHS